MADEKERSLEEDLEREIEAALGETSLLGIDRTPRRPAARAPDLDDVAVPADAEVVAGQFATAQVAGVGEEDVFLAFGPRAQGVVPREQFEAAPEVGSGVRVFVQGFDRKEGLWVCALKKTVQAAAGWGSVEPGAVVMATARAVNKGGLAVQVGHLAGFLPASHVALERVEDLESVVGQTFPVEVVEADPEKRRLVVSRRAVLVRERDQQREQRLRSLQPGDVVQGTVRKIEKFGAFVDLGGVDGLLHVSQMAWTHVEDPEQVVKVGDVVKVQVLEVSEDGRRIGLSRKPLLEDPWMRFLAEHPVGSVLEGKVTRLAHFGAFIEVAEGVEGLAHVSQLSPMPVHSPKEVVRPGDTVAVRVAGVEPERRRMSLSLLTERGDRLTDDVADDATIREVMRRGQTAEPEPTLGDILKRAMEQGKRGP